jgi:hypothetical protein
MGRTIGCMAALEAERLLSEEEKLDEMEDIM